MNARVRTRAARVCDAPLERSRLALALAGPCEPLGSSTRSPPGWQPSGLPPSCAVGTTAVRWGLESPSAVLHLPLLNDYAASLGRSCKCAGCPARLWLQDPGVRLKFVSAIKTEGETSTRYFLYWQPVCRSEVCEHNGDCRVYIAVCAACCRTNEREARRQQLKVL